MATAVAYGAMVLVANLPGAVVLLAAPERVGGGRAVRAPVPEHGAAGLATEGGSRA